MALRPASRGHLIARLVASLLVVGAVLAARGGAATGHANYFASDPKPNARVAVAPTELHVTFSEAYAPAQSSLTLIGADGKAVATGGRPGATNEEMVLNLPPLANGPYTAAFHTVSALDGDEIRGYFSFAVGAATAARPGSFHGEASATGARATLDVTPGLAGENTYRMQFSDASGAPLAAVTRVRLSIERPDQNIGVALSELSAAGAAFTGTGLEIGFDGKVRVTAQVRRQDILEDLMFVFDFSVPAPVAVASASPTPQATIQAAASPTPAGPAPQQELPVPLWAVAVAIIVVGLGALALVRMGSRGQG